MRKHAFAALAVLALAGALAIGHALASGHEATRTTQHVPWGLWVVFYIFFLGLSAGSFLLSTLVYAFGVRQLEAAGPLALLQALGCLVLGGFLIVMDLGHPMRAYEVLLHGNPTSVMAWMGIFYNVYVVVVVAELYLALRPRLVADRATSALRRFLAFGYVRLDEAALQRDRRWLKALALVGIPVAIVVHGGVGSIFAVAKARPGWFSGLFPIVFLVSALASGGALLTFLTAAFSRLETGRKRDLVRSLARLSAGLLAFDLLLLTSEILVTLYGNVPHEAIGWRLTLFGPYWWVFWFVQIALGATLPLLLVLGPRTRDDLRALGLAGFLMVTGVLGARLNLVIPPQIQPTFDALPSAYNHARFAAGYFPSATEWLVAFGTIAIGTWFFLLARRVLPLEESR
jgi:molybdopterin-containing oxidoreductase family membrane subunit